MRNDIDPARTSHESPAAPEGPCRDHRSPAAAPMFRAIPLLPAVLLLAVTLLPPATAAQEAEPTTVQEAEPTTVQEAQPTTVQDAEPTAVEADAAGAELRRTVRETYEVLPVRDGVLLRPREELRGVRSIEIAGDTLAVNGEEVSREVVRGWLGERADAVLAVADLEPEARRELFDVAATAPAPEDAPETLELDEPIEPPGEPEAEEAPEGPEEPEPPAPPERRRVRGSQTGFGTNVYVAPDEVVDDVVVIGGSVTVDGRVDGDAVVVGGRLTINGEVDRDAVAVFGSMNLGPGGEVGGDAVAVFGSVERAPGARVRGSTDQVDVWSGGTWWEPWDWTWGWTPAWSPWRDFPELVGSITGLLLLALLVAIVVAVARSTTENLSRRTGAEPVKSGIVGLLVAVLLFPVLMVVSLLLAISIIGIPILVILILVFTFVGIPALLLAVLVGYAAVCHRTGLWLGRRFGWSLASPYSAAFVGLLAINALALVGRVLDLFGGPVDLFAGMFLLAGAVVETIAGLVGFGVVFLHLWERQTRGPSGAAVEPGGAPPPVPPPATGHPRAGATTPPAAGPEAGTPGPSAEGKSPPKEDEPPPPGEPPRR